MKTDLKLVLGILFLVSPSIYGRPNSFENNERKCGYDGCPATPSDKINIHLVPHTHDDVGWLKTVDQYYYGSKSLIQKAGVQYILDSVIHELLRDPTRRFVYVESAFFFKWWDEQTTELQNKVTQLIEEGRLEFIGGAWSMNDEATTHYQSIIDQFSYGLKKLNDTFGKCARPRIGWQIDPFGHTSEMASIFAGMGYDGMFFARLDWRDKQKRFEKKAGEMIWHSSANLGKNADLFTGILRNHYSAPPGFCFDYLCNDEPIIDEGYESNVEKRLNVFYDYVKNMTKYYATNNIMLPMGDDFNYQDANMYFKNLDKIIKHSKDRKVNEKEVNIFYSTPSCYLKSLNDAQIEWPSENKDFFPYATDIHTYWSGYFTSRPTLKRYERLANNFLQVCKKLSVYDTNSSSKGLDLLREALGIMQHHDAITGTEKQKVAEDYARLVHQAIDACGHNMKNVLNKILNVKPEIHGNVEFESCLYLNESSCQISESSKKFMVTLFNPSSHETYDYVRIPVHEGEYEVKDSNDAIIPNVLTPIHGPVTHIPGRDSTAINELVFKAHVKDIASFYIKKLGQTRRHKLRNNVIKLKGSPLDDDDDDTASISNTKLELIFNKGLLTSIKSKADDQTYDFKQEFVYFEGAAGNNAPPFENRSSGAYIYRPLTEKPIQNEKVEIKVIQASFFEEVQQIFNPWVSQVIRLYKDDDTIEFEWLVGPIPVDDKIGKEIVSRFTTNINSEKIFYTDSNGREMIQRIYNDDKEEKEPMAANFYPITTKITIEDDKSRLAILTDRAQGGSCLKSGQCELLVHRRLLHDDAFGVAEALNETAFGKGVVARGKHYILIGSKTTEMRANERQVQLKKLLAPWPFFSTLNDITYKDWKETLEHTKAMDVIRANLPVDVNLLTFEPFGAKRLLVRFENIYEKNDGGKNVKFNIKEFLEFHKVSDFKETTLDGNQFLSETHRLAWKTKGDPAKKSEVVEHNEPSNIIRDDQDFDIELKPMQIRTFILFTTQ